MKIELTPEQASDIIDSLDDRIERLKLLEVEVDDPADPYFRDTIADLEAIKKLLEP